jgi:2-phospho-L-lactate/phosphoenolpyruvate guanylyltransferase
VSERIVAVVPVRSLRNGKTRLAAVLAPDARERLLRHAAEQVIHAAADAGSIESVLVVSPDPEVLTWAADLGPTVRAMSQPPHQPGLNGAIDAGREWARTIGATAIVSLFADLPLIDPADIRGLTARPEPVVLGPDRRGEGTNALLLRLAERGSEFQFAFGERSLVRHLEEARRLGLDVAVHNASGIGFDLDTPDDWADFLDAAADYESPAAHKPVECGAGVG